MQSGLKQLGNSIVAAFEPLINAVTPIINAFISKLTEATNARASQEIVDSCYYAVWNGKILMGDELRG